MSEYRILQFYYLLEAQLSFDLDKALEGKRAKPILKSSHQPLPWQPATERQNSTAKQSRAYMGSSKYQIYFGAFKTSEIFAFWQNQLNTPSEILPELLTEEDQLTCYGSFCVNAKGNLIENSLQLSGVPLFLGRVAAESLKKARHSWNFSSSFLEYKKSAKRFFKSQIQALDETKSVVTREVLTTIANHFIYEYGNWQPAEFQTLGYWVKLGHEGKPETIFSSFCLRDLEDVAKALKQGNKVGNALKSYLSESVPERIDLDQRSSQRWVLSPSFLPSGRWLANPDYQLSLQQQCAVNLATTQLSQSGIFSVNGPPGTGKTTMLRDIVAHVLVQRAAQMVTYSDPNRAFTPTKTIGNTPSKTSLFSLDRNLTGYEIVVVSSNNGAVENISKELPSRNAIANDYQAEAAYFQDVARAVAHQPDAWGLLAAVLGSKKNCEKFARSFWCEFSTALDSPSTISWAEAKQTFSSLARTVEYLIAEREDYETLVSSYHQVHQNLFKIEAQHAKTRNLLTRLKRQRQQSQVHLKESENRVARQEMTAEAIVSDKPPMILRFLSFIWKHSSVKNYLSRQAYFLIK